MRVSCDWRSFETLSYFNLASLSSSMRVLQPEVVRHNVHARILARHVVDGLLHVAATSLQQY
jgi:hypothetical protein